MHWPLLLAGSRALGSGKGGVVAGQEGRSGDFARATVVRWQQQ